MLTPRFLGEKVVSKFSYAVQSATKNWEGRLRTANNDTYYNQVAVPQAYR